MLQNPVNRRGQQWSEGVENWDNNSSFREVQGPELTYFCAAWQQESRRLRTGDGAHGKSWLNRRR